MKSNNITAQEIRGILDIARLAPSVHNTQAWRVDMSRNDYCKIYTDKRFLLNGGDPTGRQAIISLGIFSEAIRLIAYDKGYATDINLDENSVSVRFTKSPTHQQFTRKNASQLISARTTDRSVYSPIKISEDDIQHLKKASDKINTSVHIVTEPSKLHTIALLTGYGISLALTSPDFRKELSTYLLEPWSKKRRGISVKSLYIPRLIALCEPMFMRYGIGLGLESKLETKRWESASAVAIITAKGDSYQYWFDVGRTYMRLSLLIEDIGLSQATSAAIVEASNYHDDVEGLLGTSERILAVIRIGKGAKKRRHSPRVSLDEIISSN